MVELSASDIEGAAAMTVTRDERYNDPRVVEKMRTLVTDSRFQVAAAAYIDELSRVGEEEKTAALGKFVEALQVAGLPEDMIDTSFILWGVGALRTAMEREKVPSHP